MKLATAQTPAGRRAIRVEGEHCIALAYPDLGRLLVRPDWPDVANAGDGARFRLEEVRLLAPIPTPGKILCVGLNYRTHILEMGRALPEHPTLFAKYPEALVGPNDRIVRPSQTEALDWEAELAVIIGRRVRHADDHEAAAAIAGFSVLNDVTARDWQYRTPQWLQGKTFEGTTPFGPYLVTPDEVTGNVAPALELTCRVDGELVQRSSTTDLLFGPVDLVRYASTILTLNPGDVIATGTPGGVGHARTPPTYLEPGMVLQTELSEIGALENLVVAEA